MVALACPSHRACKELLSWCLGPEGGHLHRFRSAPDACLASGLRHCFAPWEEHRLLNHKKPDGDLDPPHASDVISVKGLPFLSPLPHS